MHLDTLKQQLKIFLIFFKYSNLTEYFLEGYVQKSFCLNIKFFFEYKKKRIKKAQRKKIFLEGGCISIATVHKYLTFCFQLNSI